jgi:DNA-binding NarL/FixJ family response regulator
MEPSSLPVLLVEDFAPFRNLIRTILEGRPSLHIIGEASDGLEAVQKATELKPQLILLDIGLPFLNGFEVARLVRKLAPDCKILFVSQEFSPDIVQEALNLGASGYVVKARVAKDLLTAIDAVIRGKHFVGGP